MNYNVHNLPIKEIFQDTSWNCRGPISPIEVVDLMKDIDKHGLLSPVIVMPWNKNGYKYKLVAGFCRTKAFVQLNRETIPAFIQESLTDADARILNLRENLHRRDLNIVQEANAIKPLRIEEGMSEKSIAKEFGKSLTWVSIRLMLLELEPEIQHVAASGILTQDMIKKIHSESKERRFELVRKIKDKTFRLDDVKVTKPLKVFNRHKKELPVPSIILAIQEKIYDIAGPSIVTRVLAWCAGEISYNEVRIDILKYLEDEGFDPKGYNDDIQGKLQTNANSS